MRYSVSDDIRNVVFPPISEVQRLAAARKDKGLPLIDLCQAVPDYPPAPSLLDHLADLLRDPRTARYTPDEGLPEVREALCAFYRDRYGAGMVPQQLCLTIGASGAFWLAMVVLCRAGDEVIVPLPYYFDHVMGLQSIGVRPVFVPYDEAAGGQIDPAAVAALIGPRTRAILLVSPGNPAGTLTPPEVWEALSDLARKHRLALLADETYNAFIPDLARPHALFADPDWGDYFIHIASFGKTLALTGFRAGLLAASVAFIQQALKVQDSMAICAPAITQHAMAFGVRHLQGWMADNNRMMQHRRDLFRKAFNRAGNPFTLISSGAFFAWVRHPFVGRSGREVSRRLCEEHGLAVLGGEIFGPGLEPYLRLAFGNLSEPLIPGAVRRFGTCHPD